MANSENIKVGPVYWAYHMGQKGFLYFRECIGEWVFEITGKEPTAVSTEQIDAMTKVKKI